MLDVEDRLRQQDAHVGVVEELNDDVVQDLAAAKLALELGRNEDGLESVTRALRAGEAIVAELAAGAATFRRGPTGRPTHEKGPAEKRGPWRTRGTATTRT